MNLFNLPKSTIVDKVIPKNAFDNHTNPKQKKLLSENVEKIRWVNKLSKETINIVGKELQEIQIFEIILKNNNATDEVIEIIDKAIPYRIIFILVLENLIKVSTSKKHPHPTNEDKSIIEWTFASEWLYLTEFGYKINLRQDIDFIYKDFCLQFTSYPSKTSTSETIETLISFEEGKSQILKKIQRLENKINSEKQFNIKLALNIELQKLKKELRYL